MTTLSQRAISVAAAILLVSIVAACGVGENATTGTAVPAATAYSVSGTVTGLAGGASIQLQNNGKDSLNVSANGSFTFPTALHSGDAYGVTVTTQPSATTFCTVANGSGAIASSAVTNLAISCGSVHYAYVADFNASTITQYIYGPGGGLSAAATPAVQTGTNPIFAVLDPTASHLYAVNKNGNSVSQFSIGAGGVLTPLSVPTVPTGNRPGAIAIDPTGHYAYVPNALDHNISQYTIDATGGLTPMVTPTVTAGTLEYFKAITIEPQGRYAYVLSDSGVFQFAINANGTLTLLDPAPVVSSTLFFPVRLASSGSNVYVVYDGITPEHGGTAQYSITATGRLTPLASPTVSTGSSSASIAIDPAGRFVYVPNQPGGLDNAGVPVSQFAIGSGGSLTPLAESAAAGGNVSNMANAITVDVTGQYVYVVASGKVLQYTVGSDGALTPMAIPSVTASSTGAVAIVTK